VVVVEGAVEAAVAVEEVVVVVDGAGNHDWKNGTME
jgi:hypothetical protein